MKNNHVKTAIKALKRQRDKYEIERDRFDASEKSAHESKMFFAYEIEKLDKQIASLEEVGEKQKELELT